MRLFTAILLSEEIKSRIYEVQQKMRPCFESGRFSDRGNFHLTLIFLGEVPDEKIPLAQKALCAVHAAPFELQIGGIGCFRRESGNIYWAGVERSEPLASLHATLCKELKACGFQTDSRPYRPHLTLIRQAVPKSGCDSSGFDVPILRMQVEKISLMKSERLGGRLTYTEIDRRYLRDR